MRGILLGTVLIATSSVVGCSRLTCIELVRSPTKVEGAKQGKNGNQERQPVAGKDDGKLELQPVFGRAKKPDRKNMERLFRQLPMEDRKSMCDSVLLETTPPITE